jgi:transglutaminase-like putative cysteine protease
MLIRYGFVIDLRLWQPTTVITVMDVHESQREDVAWENEFETSPAVHVQTFVDEDGNKLRRLTAGPGIVGMKLTGVVNNSGALDDCDPNAELVPVEDLPPEALPYLRSSRYCETDLLSDFAWGAFGWITGGYARVPAVCDYVHDRLRFSYPEARPTRTARKRWTSKSGFAAISPILPSRFAAA